MTRLYDRILSAGGCRPFNSSAFGRNDHLAEANLGDMRESLREVFRSKEGHEPTDKEIDAVLQTIRADPARLLPTALEHLAVQDLQDIPVIAGDDVARYCLSIGPVDMASIVSILAPPFERFFVEFQGVDNQLGASAWGVLVQVERTSDRSWSLDPLVGEVGWIVHLALVAENQHGQIFGPIMRYFLGLDTEGFWLRHERGQVA